MVVWAILIVRIAYWHGVPERICANQSLPYCLQILDFQYINILVSHCVLDMSMHALSLSLSLFAIVGFCDCVLVCLLVLTKNKNTSHASGGWRCDGHNVVSLRRLSAGPCIDLHPIASPVGEHTPLSTATGMLYIHTNIGMHQENH